MELLRELLTSKKFVAMLVGIITVVVTKIGWDIDHDTISQIVALVASYIVGQGFADKGKEAARIASAARTEKKME